MRVDANFLHQLLRGFAGLTFVWDEGPRHCIGRGEDAQIPQQVVLPDMDVQQRIFAQDAHQQQRGDERTADVCHTASDDLQVGVVEQGDVSICRRDRPVDSLLEYVR